MTNWLSNNKVEISVVTIDSKQFLVCKRIVSSHSIVFVEDIETGKRAIPEAGRAGFQLEDAELVVRELIKQLT